MGQKIGSLTLDQPGLTVTLVRPAKLLVYEQKPLIEINASDAVSVTVVLAHLIEATSQAALTEPIRPYGSGLGRFVIGVMTI